MKEIIKKLSQFIKFTIVGFSNTVIYYVVYLLLFYLLGINYIVSNVVGFVISIINSFYWNNKYVFNLRDAGKRNLIHAFFKTFAAYAGTGLVLNNILLVIWVEVLEIPEVVAPVINLFITTPINFILNKFWTFKEK